MLFDPIDNIDEIITAFNAYVVNFLWFSLKASRYKILLITAALKHGEKLKYTEFQYSTGCYKKFHGITLIRRFLICLNS